MDNAKAISFMDRLRANKKKLNIILRNQDRNNDRQIQVIYELKYAHLFKPSSIFLNMYIRGQRKHC